MSYRTIPCTHTSHFTQRFSQYRPHQLVMSAKRPLPSGGSTGRKKPFLQHPYKCLHPNCLKSFKSPNGICMHFGKLQQCSNFKMSGHNTRAKTAFQPPAAEGQESLTEYPWDEDDSVHESEDASSVKDIISTGAPNNQAGVYTGSANDAALRFGIRFTTEQLHETKLLKLLSDANAPQHYLYKEVMAGVGRGCCTQ
jgi:hypothetical protein